jgi:hypothetical protein
MYFQILEEPIMYTPQSEQKRTSSAAYLSMQSCIDICNRCAQTCLQTAMNHCLETGGRHVEPEHFRLMMNCAEICQLSANFMLSSSRFHNLTCEVCAEICEACAMDCDSIGDMEECASICHKCAESCKQMASMSMH